MMPSFTPDKDEEDKMATDTSMQQEEQTPSIRTFASSFLQTPSFMTPSAYSKAPLTAATQPMTPMTVSPEEPKAVSPRVSSQPGTAPTTAPYPREVVYDEEVRVDYRPNRSFGGSRLFADSATPIPEDRRPRPVTPPPVPSHQQLSHRPALSSSCIPEPYPIRRVSAESESCRSSSVGSVQGRRESGRQVEDPWIINDNATRRRSSSASLHRQRSLQTPVGAYISTAKPILDVTPDTSSSSESSPDVSPSPHRSESKRRRRRHLSPPPELDRSCVGRLKHIRTNRLFLVLSVFGVASILLTVMTSRAVIPKDEPVQKDAFRPDRPVKPGIRIPGSMTRKKKEKPDSDKLRSTKDDHKHHDDKHKKDSHKDKDHKKDPHKDMDKKHDDHHKDSKKHHEKKEHLHNRQSENPVLQRQELHLKGYKAPLLGGQVLAALGYDEKMYKKSSKSEMTPRILMLHESATPHPQRHVESAASPVFDNTQLYGILSSDDEALSKMEMREPHSDGECVPMQEWQTTFHPSCNDMHSLALEHMGESNGKDVSLFGTKGYWRNAWKLSNPIEHDAVVLKTLKFQHNFEDAHFEHDRIDAVAMERLTSSPHVINVFGFCGHSVLTEYADGKRLGELADKSKKTPLARLKIARDIAEGLADVHGIDGPGNATFVHLDVNPANVVSIGGRLKLNDFNIGILLRWNTTSNKQCGFPAQYPNPQWRSPEEARGEQNLTEKVDVFSMGHIFFRLICGHEPWNKLEPGGKPSKEEVNEKVQKGELPFIPEHVKNATDPELIAIRDVMLKCYTSEPDSRPSSREIATILDDALIKMTSESNERM